MGCTYVKEFSFGGKVTPTAAVHKHEEALHPGKPMTKMAKGGKVMEKATGEVYPSRKAMMKHEKEETPRMQREEIMQKSSMRAPRRAMPVASSEPLIAMKKGGPPPRPPMPQRPMPDPRTQMGAQRPMPQPQRDPRPMPQPQRDPRPMPERPMPKPPMQQNTASAVGRPMLQPPMMKKGGMANPNC